MGSKHPRTAMIDLLEDLRLAIKGRDPQLSNAQVVAVLAELMADHAGLAFTALSQINEGVSADGCKYDR